MIPHGLYDIYRHIGYITLGTSRDTSEFAGECIRHWWLNPGMRDSPGATNILLLCDGGGSHKVRHDIFQEDLQKLSDEGGIEIRIAHYPPYTSKYNPIEPRWFSHVSKAGEGVIFRRVEWVNEGMGKTKTSTGLKVFTSILDKTFETGRNVTQGFKNNLRIQFDNFLPQWNYVVLPFHT